MISTGEVIAVNGNIATVLVVKKSACGHDCSDCGVCTAPQIQTTAINNVGAKVGNRVEIETTDNSLLKVAFYLYLCPILFAVLIGIVSKILRWSLWINGLIYIVMFVVWYFYLKRINNRIGDNNIVLRILD